MHQAHETTHAFYSLPPAQHSSNADQLPHPTNHEYYMKYRSTHSPPASALRLDHLAYKNANVYHPANLMIHNQNVPVTIPIESKHGQH